ncbi:nuclear transport factor 2 family protein [Variovorax sp. H27-G14]|uniref:nuclear transport factor 2 family protein n=1 Tax=Variovorax sp. H27-G14 TaxID=3111914 RepID=UPI0038FCFDC4
MDTTREAELTELLDRERIRDCIHRYCRGIDRRDEAALLSSYWPGAKERHGAYVGNAEGFIKVAMARMQVGERYIHFVSNSTFAFRGAAADVESYFLVLIREPDAHNVQQDVLLAGRYMDVFKKRQSEWRVAERTVLFDWFQPLGAPAGTEAERFGARLPIGSFYPDDPTSTLFAPHHG